jgi:hypothetical protein
MVRCLPENDCLPTAPTVHTELKAGPRTSCKPRDAFSEDGCLHDSHLLLTRFLASLTLNKVQESQELLLNSHASILRPSQKDVVKVAWGNGLN